MHSGGNFDINFMVSDPDYMVVVMGDGEGSGDYVFAGEKEGEYSFCFMNGTVLSSSSSSVTCCCRLLTARSDDA